MHQYDISGVGIGPFNLSLAALLSKIPHISSSFYEQSNQFIWHPGMLLQDATVQVNFLYDLVTLVDPTSPYSFLAYLTAKKRIYRFASGNFMRPTRKEFSDYYAWVSQQLPNLHFGEKVLGVTHKNQQFTVHTNKKIIQTKDLVLGTGLTPHVPEFAKVYMGKHILHSSDFLIQKQNWHDKRVVIVGGGQSGAEIFHHLIQHDHQLPRELYWISKRESFLPMDETPFTNEIYTPGHTENFYRQNTVQKQTILQEQLLSSDGISTELLEMIYQRLYAIECVGGRQQRIHLLPRHCLTAMFAEGEQLQVHNTHTDDYFSVNADITIFCTGYQWELPECIEPIKDKIKFNQQHKFEVNNDYSIAWEHGDTNSIYVQNGARHTHGVTDPNLPVAAWRSAKIINSMMDKEIYAIDNENTAIKWGFILNNRNGVVTCRKQL